jgi:hypothetical protein
VKGQRLDQDVEIGQRIPVRVQAQKSPAGRPSGHRNGYLDAPRLGGALSY